jgi:hypothetical protein
VERWAELLGAATRCLSAHGALAVLCNDEQIPVIYELVRQQNLHVHHKYNFMTVPYWEGQLCYFMNDPHRSRSALPYVQVLGTLQI